MNKKKVRQIVMCYILLLTGISFAQIGIGIEKPEADLDVNGTVRLRQLGNPIPYNRTIVSDKDGNLGYLDQGEDSYIVKNVLYRLMPKTVSSKLYSASNLTGTSNLLIELDLDLVVEIQSYTTTAISIEYNVPITAVLTAADSKLPGYIGITMVKNENGSLTELEEGSRKFTFYSVEQNYAKNRYISMPVSGKATDIITNTSSQKKSITYSVKGYIEMGAGTMYYGNPLSDSENFGTGVLVIQVYEKRL